MLSKLNLYKLVLLFLTIRAMCPTLFALGSSILSLILTRRKLLINPMIF